MQGVVKINNVKDFDMLMWRLQDNGHYVNKNVQPREVKYTKSSTIWLTKDFEIITQFQVANNKDYYNGKNFFLIDFREFYNSVLLGYPLNPFDN